MNPPIGPYDFIILGLTVDLCGGLILAKGFVFKSIPSVIREAQTRLGGNSAMVRSALLQRSEAVLGGLLLAIGFGLQAWGNFHGGPAANELSWINSRARLAAVAVAVIGVSVAAWAVGRWLAVRSFRHHFAGPDPWLSGHAKKGTGEARDRGKAS